ncbi:MAG: hypothetical protein WDW38_010894 [Sanguina aurantia]
MARPHLTTAVVLLLAFLQTETFSAQPTSDPAAIAKICKVSVETNDLSCLHGGYLRAENVTDEPTSCSECICPSGWAGSDCSLCTATSSCPPMTLPDGTVIPASGCTSHSITPVLNEFAVGKSLSCTCGGDDASTEYICAQQPGTVLDIAFWPAGASGQRSNGNASAKVYERAGLYSADYVPAWVTPDCDPNASEPECYSRERWKPYWSHHCLPGTYPGPGKALTLSCQPTQGVDGKFQCYITQEGSYVASLGMRCSTGSCLYNVAPPPPEPAPPYSPGPRPDPSPSPPQPPPAPHHRVPLLRSICTQRHCC